MFKIGLMDFILMFGIEATIGVVLILYFSKRLGNYADKKLVGEIQKDVEGVKGDINKDIEDVKGKIQSNIEEMKVFENRFDITNNRYVDVVTNQRIQWLDKLRGDISKIYSSVVLIGHMGEHSNLKKLLQELIYSLNHLILSLNFKSDEDIKVISLLKEMEQNIKDFGLTLYCRDSEYVRETLKISDDIDLNDLNKELLIKIEGNLEKLISASQKILKAEWEKVKEEAEKGVKIN